MNKYQVTARFKNIWEVVGADVVDAATAWRLFHVYLNSGRPVTMHAIIGNGSIVVQEGNH